MVNGRCPLLGWPTPLVFVNARIRCEGGDEMFFKRKNQKGVTVSEMPSEPVCTDGAYAPTYEEYVSCMEKCKSEIDGEIDAYFIAAHNLKISAKRISRVRGVYSSKLSARKKRKHGVNIQIYKDSLSSYADIASRIMWLLDTYASCANGAVAMTKKPRAARKLRRKADEYSENILSRKKKIEDITDGIVMPVSTYVN